MFSKNNFIIIFTLLFNYSFSQEINLKGKVYDENNNNIVGATITIKDYKDANLLGYNITNGNGLFDLFFLTPSEKKIIIKVSHLSSKPFLDTITINKTVIDLEIKLYQKTFEIKPIVISSKKIKDTLKIKTDSLNLTERSTLRNILEKTEGFVVSNEGGITFRGKKINKILINKKEVFINQNKIGLDNLEFGMMNDLQLINNYTDKFNLDFDNFTSSVLNVNTKSKFTGVLKSYGDFAIGFKNKYLLKLKSFLFSDNLNAFLTSNTNNYGDKDFNFNDISNSFKIQSSTFFKENITSFFDEDDFLRNSFSSNSSITLRKENKNSKIGLVFYYNHLNENKNIYQTTESTNSILFKKENKTFSNKGNSIISNFSYSNKINQNAIFSLLSDLVYTKMKNNNFLEINNFLPILNKISETNLNIPKTFISSTNLSFKYKFNKNLIFSSFFDYNFEKSNSNFISNFQIINNESLRQVFSFSNQNVNSLFFVDYRFSNYLTSGIGQKTIVINDKLNYKEEINRKLVLTETILQLRGQKAKIEYNFELKPQTYNFINKNVSKYNLNTTINYKTNESNRFNLSFERNNKLTDINNNIDTLAVSFNNRLINKNSIFDNIESSTNLSLGYNYSSIIKTQSISASYSNSSEKNTLQSIFLNENNNVFYFSNRLIDNKKISTYKLSFGKGFYFSKKYHLLRVKNFFTFSENQFPIFLSKESVYNITNFSINSSFGVELKNKFLDEMFFNINFNEQKSYLDKSILNKNRKIYLFTTFEKKLDKFEFKMTLGEDFQQNQNFKFKMPVFHLDILNKFNDSFSIFLKSRYLFHLFNLKNTNLTRLNVESDGNLVNSNYNQDNLNYLITGISYKF